MRAAIAVLIGTLSLLGGACTTAASPTPRPAPTQTLGVVVNESATPQAAALDPATLSRQASSYSGTWLNGDAKTSGVTRLVIGAAGPTVSVHAFSACSVSSATVLPASPGPVQAQPTAKPAAGECDLGTRTVNYQGDPLTLSFDGGRAGVRQLSLSFTDANRTALQVVDVNGTYGGRNTYSFSYAKAPTVP